MIRKVFIDLSEGFLNRKFNNTFFNKKVFLLSRNKTNSLLLDCRAFLGLAFIVEGHLGFHSCVNCHTCNDKDGLAMTSYQCFVHYRPKFTFLFTRKWESNVLALYSKKKTLAKPMPSKKKNTTKKLLDNYKAMCWSALGLACLHHISDFVHVKIILCIKCHKTAEHSSFSTGL